MKIQGRIMLFASALFFSAGLCVSAGDVFKISVEGNHRVPAREVIEASGLWTGAPFSAAEVREAVRRLYASGYIDDVSVERREDERGVEIVLQIKERPVIGSIAFQGNAAYGDRKLLLASGLSEGAFFNPRELAKAREGILSLYREAGFSGGEVAAETEEDPGRGEVDVMFKIKEGSVVRRVDIEFFGNTVFTRREIRRAMHTGRRGIFRAHPFRRETLEEDIQRIALLYRGRGYIDVEVSLRELSVDDDGKQALVRIDIEEGDKYTVRSLEIPGEYDEKILLAEGSPFSPEGLQDDVRRVYDYLYEKGFLYAEVRPDRLIDREAREVDVRFSVREGPVVYVERIDISGNIRTRDDVIRREIRLAPGDRFDIIKARESQRRIRNLGRRQPFFERVTFEIEEGTSFDRKNLHFKVEEGKTGSLLFGAGYSSDDKIVGFVEAHVDNFDIANPPGFMGAGQDLSLKGEIGSERRDYTLSFTEPWLFHVPLSLGLDAYDRIREWRDYDEGRAGGRLRLGYPAGENNRVSLGYKYEDVDISNLAPGVSDEIRREEGRHGISALTLGFTRDSRDSFFEPRSGARSGITLELAGGPFRGDKDFRKYSARTSVYYPAWPGGALNLRLEGGYAEAFSGTEVVPVYERFYLGGADTVRGYPYRDIGPKDAEGRPVGGTVRLMANAEYIVPVFRALRGAVFFDSGNVWSSRRDFDPGDLAAGAGIGIRVMSPLGPLRLDYAYGFDRKQTRVHFTIGWPF